MFSPRFTLSLLNIGSRPDAGGCEGESARVKDVCLFGDLSAGRGLEKERGL